MSQKQKVANDMEKKSTVESYDFSPVSCLLTAEELTEKADELYSITWNGLNRP